MLQDVDPQKSSEFFYALKKIIDLKINVKCICVGRNVDYSNKVIVNLLKNLKIENDVFLLVKIILIIYIMPLISMFYHQNMEKLFQMLLLSQCYQALHVWLQILEILSYNY